MKFWYIRENGGTWGTFEDYAKTLREKKYLGKFIKYEFWLEEIVFFSGSYCVWGWNFYGSGED